MLKVSGLGACPYSSKLKDSKIVASTQIKGIGHSFYKFWIIHNFIYLLWNKTNQYKVTDRNIWNTSTSASPLQQENLPWHKLSSTQHEKQCFIIPTQFYIETQVFRLNYSTKLVLIIPNILFLLTKESQTQLLENF